MKPESKLVTTGCPASVSSALLGAFVIPSFRAAWDHYLLMLSLLFGMWVCGRILWEEYSPNFHRKKSDGKTQQKCRQPDNATSGNLRKLGSANENLGMTLCNLHTRVQPERPIVNNIRRFVAKLINPCLKFLSFAHSAITPNSVIGTKPGAKDKLD